MTNGHLSRHSAGSKAAFPNTPYGPPTASTSNNFLNPAANSQALTDSLKANPYRIATSKLESTDVKASRELFQLPAGPLALAVGAERRKESVEDAIDPLSAQSLIVGSGGSTANGSRTLTSIYGELSIPIVKNLEGLQSALRSGC